MHLWYDEGISAGSSWRGDIATAIKGAAKFLFYISESSLASSHCLREVDYALSNDIEIIPVYLDDSGLPGELDLVLNRVQALFRETDDLAVLHVGNVERIYRWLTACNGWVAPAPITTAWASICIYLLSRIHVNYTVNYQL